VRLSEQLCNSERVTDRAASSLYYRSYRRRATEEGGTREHSLDRSNRRSSACAARLRRARFL